MTLWNRLTNLSGGSDWHHESPPSDAKQRPGDIIVYPFLKHDVVFFVHTYGRRSFNKGGRALSPFFGPLQKPKYESYGTTIFSRCFSS